MKALRNVALGAMTALALVSPFVVLLALPTFDGGLFRQTETVAVGVHVVACACAFCLMAMTIVGLRDIGRAVSLPVLALASMALAGLVTAGFSDSVPRDFYGTLEHGIGILWLAETALMAVAFGMSWTMVPRARTALAMVPLASVVVCAALQVARIATKEGPAIPYGFPEYLGLNAMLAAVPALTLRRRWLTLTSVVVLVACAAISANRGVALALVVAACLYAMTRSARGRRVAVKYLPAGAAIGTLAIAAVLLVAAPALQGLATMGVTDATAPAVPSVASVDHVAVQSKPYGTLWLRSVTARLTLDYLLERPARLLTGTGFGSFETVAETQHRLAPGRLMVPAIPTASLSYWDGDQKAKFHSHDQAIESLLSSGLLGLAAWVFLVWSAARCSARHAAAGAVLVALLVVGAGLWFLVNAAAPLLALAFAATACAIARPETAEDEPTSLSGQALAAGATLTFASLGVVTAAATAFSYTALRGERMERYFFPLPIFTCSGYSAVTMPNSDINRNLYAILVRRIEESKKPKDEAVKDRYNIANLSCMLRRYVERDDVLALIQSLKARYNLDAAAGGGRVVPAILAPDFAKWPDDVDHLLNLAPTKTEFVVPYVSWLQSRGDNQAVVKAVERFAPRIKEGDPVRDWLLAQRDRAGGQSGDANVKKAMQEGFANLFPTPLAQVRGLMGK